MFASEEVLRSATAEALRILVKYRVGCDVKRPKTASDG